MGIFRIIVFSLILMSFSSVSWGHDWQFLFQTRIDSYYYDKSEITQKSKNVVQVWVKRNLKNGAEGIEEKYNGIDHIISLEEYDCARHKQRTVSHTTYDQDGKAVRSEQDKKAKWDYIDPNSAADCLLRYTCKKKRLL